MSLITIESVLPVHKLGRPASNRNRKTSPVKIMHLIPAVLYCHGSYTPALCGTRPGLSHSNGWSMDRDIINAEIEYRSCPRCRDRAERENIMIDTKPANIPCSVE